MIGNGKTKGGVRTASRVYEAPDGAKGQVAYVTHDSLPAAEEQIETWVKVTSKVTSREQNQMNKKDQLVSDRVLATGDLPKSGQKEFVIIRRDGLNCYLIESVSLEVATQIEDLIEHK